ncbi:hypothetical protein K474DRAFT_659976 [Panus rudis PR-1116 ss-1]|nr:hypothetical protein K474DRAFT_659976 [Panus rudis PR-1116 ss-1]
MSVSHPSPIAPRTSSAATLPTTSTSTTDASSHPSCVPQGSRVTRAYGLHLDDDCVFRWGKDYYERHYPGKLDKLTPEEVREKVDSIMSVTTAYIPHELYKAFPHLPRLRRNVLLIRFPRSLEWLLVLKDNSSKEALHAPLSMEDVMRVKEFLGVRKQGAKWYNVSNRIE